LRLKEPDLENNLPDVERIQQVAGREFTIPLKILERLPYVLRESKWDVNLTWYIPRNYVLDVSPASSKNGNFALACDLGTTTVVLHLLDLSRGKVINTKAEYNRQIMVAEDVISRIILAEEEGGLQELKALALETINELIVKICEDTDISSREITAILIAGDTSKT